jgi:hypothetical protein
MPRPMPAMEPEAQSPQLSPAESQLDAATTLASRTPVGSEIMGADGKAAIVLSLLGIMFTVLARFGSELGVILRHGMTGTGIVRVMCFVLLLGFAGFALCAVLQAFRTILPRFRKDKPSLAFFAEIAGMEREEYFAKVESLTTRQALDEILRYNHTASTICADKFKELGRALRCFEVASACWLGLVLILVFKSLHG